MKSISTVLALGALFGCSRVDNKSTTGAIDSLETGKIDTAVSVPTASGANVDTATIAVDDYESMYRLHNYLTQANGSKPEVIDFNCAILIYPTDEQIEEAK